MIAGRAPLFTAVRVGASVISSTRKTCGEVRIFPTNAPKSWGKKGCGVELYYVTFAARHLARASGVGRRSRRGKRVKLRGS